MAIQRVEGEHSNVLEAALETGKAKSRICREIMEFLAADTRPFDVILLEPEEKYGQMLTESDTSGEQAVRARAKFSGAFDEKKIGYPVVLWNPYYQFNYFGNVEGLEVNPSGALTPRKESAIRSGDPYLQHVGKFSTIKIPAVLMVDSTMPSWVVLYHELGHVKQYYEAGGEAAWKKKLAKVAAIEADNLKRHENPICVDVKLPIRAHYKHMSLGLEGVLQTYGSKTKQPALIREASLDRLKARKNELLRQATENEAQQRKSGVGGPKIHGFFVKR